MLVLLVSCSDENVNIDSFKSIGQNTKINKIHKKNEHSPFSIESINSQILPLNDPASEEPLRGVNYEVLLFSKEEISPEKILSLKFDIVAHSILKESLLGPIPDAPINLAQTLSEGYLYRLQFATNFRNYTQRELEDLNNDRNFQLFVEYDGKKYPIEKTTERTNK